MAYYGQQGGYTGGDTPAGPGAGGYGPPPTPNGGGAVRFDVIGEGFQLLTRQMGNWLAAIVVAAIVMLVVGGIAYAGVLASVLPAILAGGGGRGSGPPFSAFGASFFVAYLIFLVVVTVASALLAAGLFNMAIKQVRGLDISLSDLFNAWPTVGRMIGAAILINLASSGAQLLPLIPLFFTAAASGRDADSGPLFGIAVLISALAALWVFVVTLLTWPLLVDRKIGVLAAIRRSFDALKGQWLTVTGVALVLVILNTVAAIPCGLGLLFTYPASFLAIALMYRDVLGVDALPGFDGPGIGGGNAPGIEMPLPPPSDR